MDISIIDHKTIIFEAHLPEQAMVATDLVSRGCKVTLYASYLSSALRRLLKNPLVQIRFCKENACNT